LKKNNSVRFKTARQKTPDRLDDVDTSLSHIPLALPRYRVAILLIVSLSLAVTALWFDSPSKLLQLQAKRELDHFKAAAALAWLDIARVFSDRNAETELLAARAARRQGNSEDFRQFMQQARRLGADSKRARLEEVLAIAQSGAIDRCEEELIAFMLSPVAETDEISDAYANGLAAASRFEDAVSVLTAWGADYPSDPRPHYRMGRIHEHSQRWQEAEKSYLDAINRNESFYPGWYALGRSFAMRRQMDPAIVAYSKCLDSNRPQAAMIQLASCYRAKAEATLSRKYLAIVLDSDVDEIVSSYRDFEESPEYFDAATQYADLLAETGDFSQSVRWYRRALAHNDRDITARYGLALALRSIGKVDIAETEFERVRVSRNALERANRLRDQIANDVQQLDARLQLGNLLIQHESERMGLFWIRSIFSLDPDNPMAHGALADYYESKTFHDSTDKATASYHRSKASTATQSVSAKK